MQPIVSQYLETRNNLCHERLKLSKRINQVY